MTDVAYVLIQCDLGSEESIIQQIMEIPEAKEVRGTYGIYDVFCKVESDTDGTLDNVITNRIRKIPKIRSTITLHYIPSQGGK
ncbi:MAG: Lrp/AsnC ligand binding domain-containing protein [Thaumarchaeota archaeon]|nr:Lrp/AsnC ligand binding domain-containing protein [Nitrososphaerota archaeon]